VPNEADVAAFKNYTPSGDAIDSQPAGAPVKAQPESPTPTAAPAAVPTGSYPPHTTGVFIDDLVFNTKYLQ